MGAHVDAATGGSNLGSGWIQVHERLVGLARQSSELDWEIGRALLAAERARCHERLGYCSLFEYADRTLGFAPHTTRERLRVARALEELPEMTAALKAGEVNLSAVRELTRVAAPETETAWLGRARNLRVRDVEELVRGHEVGDLPDDPRNVEATTQVLRYEVRPEVYALLREALAAAQQEADGALDDSAFLERLARCYLQGPADDGRASYQIALTTCEECKRTWQQARGKQVLVSHEVREMAECDAQHIGSVEASGEAQARATQTIPPATRRKVLRRDGGCCAVPGCHNSDFVDLHHTKLRSEGGNHDPDKLITLCSAHHRATHDGRLLIDGDAVSGFVFRHADGREYGARPEPAAAEVYAKAFAALTHLGFQSKLVRPVLERVRSRVGPVAVQDVIKAALRELTTPPSRSRSP